MTQSYLLTTRRLSIRSAGIGDSDFIHRLWMMHDVMRLVGFPEGLAVSAHDVRSTIEKNADSEFQSLLIAEVRGTQIPIGQCRIGTPDTDGSCEPDIKLLPAFWVTDMGANCGQQ